MSEKRWVAPERNYEGIQFAELRHEIESRYNAVHDELTDCYYSGLPYKGRMLTKTEFDQLHAQIFDRLAVEFHL